MYVFEKLNSSSIFLYLVVTLVLYYFISYNWKRRWLYYHASKIPGPFSFPLIGVARLIFQGGPEELLNTIKHLVKSYPPIFKTWLGTKLYIFTTRPQDVHIILSKVLQKSIIYKFGSPYFEDSLLLESVDLWKIKRRVINKTFHTTVITSFFTIFVKYSNELAENLSKYSEDRKPVDIFPEFLKNALNIACESLGDVDPSILRGKDEHLTGLFRNEELLLQRFYNPFLFPDFFWKLSSIGKEMLKIHEEAKNFVLQMLSLKKPLVSKEELNGRNYNEDSDNKLHVDDSIPDLKDKRFLNYLLNLTPKEKLLNEYAIVKESILQMAAASETTAVAMSSVLLILGLHPHIQEKLHVELSTVLKNGPKNMTLDDVNRLHYLERVIKETMRVLPPIPFIARTVEKDIPLDTFVLPAGSDIFIPIMHLHTKEDLWPDPYKFDPDRFLPDEISKRHRCAYIPFSWGSRNCIGLKYAILSMKIFLTIFLMRYKVVETVDYKKIEDVDSVFVIVAKAKKGYRIVLEKRTN